MGRPQRISSLKPDRKCAGLPGPAERSVCRHVMASLGMLRAAKDERPVRLGHVAWVAIGQVHSSSQLMLCLMGGGAHMPQLKDRQGCA
jgi:hypothetical protein